MVRYAVVLLLSISVLLGGCDSSTTGADPSETPASRAVETAVPPPAGPVAVASPAQTIDPAAAEPSGERTLAHVQALAARIGPRPAGSDADRAAVDYIAGALRAAGYTVESQPFPVERFVSRVIDVTLLDPRESLRAAPMTNSPPGTAAAEVYFADLGLAGDYPPDGLGGRIALVRRGQLEFGEKARNAAAAGASALVLYDPAGDLLTGTLTGMLPALPVVAITAPDGARLRDQARAGAVRLAVSFDGGIERFTTTNVIGRPAGGVCQVVVGGHYDSVEVAPGASDNATGTAAVLEMARVQAARGNLEGACFIAFGGEELGLLGSRYYVGALSESERRQIRFMINLDMVAVGDSWRLIGSRALLPQAQAIASSLGVESSPAELVGASSDHAAFIDRRIPAVMLHRFDDRLLHTPQDTADRITAPPLETAVRLGLAFLAGLNPS